MNREFPELLQKLHRIDIDYDDGNGIDFEPYDSFYSDIDTSSWIKAWTGNTGLDGKEYRIFGQDGSGGYVAFWCIRNTRDVLEQPVVFFGSEGELGVIARNFYEYVWLFAGGIGPYEAVAYPDIELHKNQKFIEFAEEHASSYKNSPREIIANATNEFPDFINSVQTQCR